MCRDISAYTLVCICMQRGRGTHVYVCVRVH